MAATFLLHPLVPTSPSSDRRKRPVLEGVWPSVRWCNSRFERDSQSFFLNELSWVLGSESQDWRRRGLRSHSCIPSKNDKIKEQISWRKRQENQVGVAKCIKMKCDLPLEFCFGPPLKIRGGFGTMLGV